MSALLRYTTYYIIPTYAFLLTGESRPSLLLSTTADHRLALFSASRHSGSACNSGVIFTAFTHHRAHTLPGSLSAFPCNYSLHQRFCGHIIYLTMRIHYKVTKFTVSSIFLNIRVILLLFNNTGYCSLRFQCSA